MEMKETVMYERYFYKQDFLDPLSFIIASEEVSVSREGIIGIVNNITVVNDDTVYI